MQRIITRTVPVNGMLFSEHLPGMAYQGEQNAHRFVIHAVDDSAPVTLSGSVLAEFVRADGITVPVTGSIADGAAVVTLSGDCYGAIGRAELTIFVTASGATTAVYHAVTSVTRTRTDAVADQPGLIDLPALQARFEDMGEAISDAEAAAVAANAAAAAANEAAENVSGDVAELKSALGKDEITSLLLADTIPDTIQAITFDARGNVQTITHSRDGATMRTDAFVFADDGITETRTLATGEILTIITNTDTLVTTTTYAEETA